MKYKIEGAKINFNNNTTDFRASIDKDPEEKICSIVSNQNESCIFYISKQDNPCIFKCNCFDFTMNKKITYFCRKNEIYDLIYDEMQENLYFSDGKNVLSFSEKTQVVKEIFNFSRVRLSPISLAISPMSTMLSFTVWKSNAERLKIYSLKTDSMIDFDIPINSYCWLDENIILYERSSKLILLNVEINEKKIIINSFIKLCNQSKIYKDLFYACKKNSIFIDEIKDIMHVDNRIYFKFMTIVDDQKMIGIGSIARSFDDLVIHCQKKEGLIYEYDVVENGRVIHATITPNKLRGDNFKTYHIEVIDGNEVNVSKEDGDIITTPGKPTKLEVVNNIVSFA